MQLQMRKWGFAWSSLFGVGTNMLQPTKMTRRRRQLLLLIQCPIWQR